MLSVFRSLILSKALFVKVRSGCYYPFGKVITPNVVKLLWPRFPEAEVQNVGIKDFCTNHLSKSCFKENNESGTDISFFLHIVLGRSKEKK